MGQLVRCRARRRSSWICATLVAAGLVGLRCGRSFSVWRNAQRAQRSWHRPSWGSARPSEILGRCGIAGPRHRRHLQVGSKALPDSDLSELFSYLQQLADANAASIPDFDFEIWPAASAADFPEPIIDPNTKYVLGPDGNPLIDLSTHKPIVEDWYQQLITLQAGIIKGIDATLRKIGVPQAFGWSIVVYTFFIKIVTYPFTRASARSAVLMKVAAPGLKQITEAESLSSEQKVELTNKIYGLVGENPFSGCLPILATLPIYFTLIGAWRRLGYERFPHFSEPWLWVPNLSQPNPDFNISFDWLLQFTANGDPVIGWHDYLSYLVFPVVLVINTVVSAFQSAKKEGKGEGPPVGLTLFSVFLVGCICLDLPQAYAVYYLANQVFTAGQSYLANESLRNEIPGFEEYEKTGQFPGWALENMALLREVPMSLHEAAKNGNNDAVTAFLADKSVDINAWDEAKVTPIGYAVAKGHLSTVRLLMSRGANVEATDGAGHTLFHFAAYYSHVKVMKELVEASKEAYPDNSWAFLKDEIGQTPMDAAVFCKDPGMIELFQEFGLKPDLPPPPKTLHEAVMKGDDDAVVAFLDGDSVDIDAWDEAKVTPMCYAIATGHLSTVRLLMVRGASMRAVDGVGNTLFHFAAFYSQTDVMKVLVEATKDAYPDNSWADVENQSGQTPLDVAANVKNPEMIELLKGFGLKPPEALELAVPAPTSLHEAARSGDDDAVTAFLHDESVDIDAWDEVKVTPIGYAVAAGHLATVKLLLSRGAKVQAADGAGNTLFHYAACYSHAKIMQELVEASKDAYPDNSWAHLKDQNGKTPLDAVSFCKDPDMMEVFRGFGLEIAHEPQPVTAGEVTTTAKEAAAAVAMAVPAHGEAVTAPPVAKPVKSAARAVD